MINRHEMSPSTRSNNFTNINFCHRESLTWNDLPDTEVLLCFSFMASGTDNEQMHLYQQEFQQRQAYKALSEGNHNGHGHGTAQGESANMKTGINSHALFPQFHNLSFGTRGRQHQRQLLVKLWSFPVYLVLHSPLVKLAPAAVWFKSL